MNKGNYFFYIFILFYFILYATSLYVKLQSFEHGLNVDLDNEEINIIDFNFMQSLLVAQIIKAIKHLKQACKNKERM